MLCMVFAVLLSVAVLKRSYSLTQYLAVLVVMIGITIATLTSYYETPSEDDLVISDNTI